MRSSTCKSQLVANLLELFFLLWLFGVSRSQTKKTNVEFFYIISTVVSKTASVFLRQPQSQSISLFLTRTSSSGREFFGSVLRRCKVQNHEVSITFELFCCSNNFCKTTSLVFTAKVTIDNFCWNRKIRRQFLWFFPGVCTLIIRRSERLQILTTGFDNQAKLSVYVVFLSLEGNTTVRFPTC